MDPRERECLHQSPSGRFEHRMTCSQVWRQESRANSDFAVARAGRRTLQEGTTARRLEERFTWHAACAAKYEVRAARRLCPAFTGYRAQARDSTLAGPK